MQLRILIIAPDFHPNVSGYGNACTGFVQALSSVGSVAVDVLTFSSLDSAPEVDWPNVSIYRLVRDRRFLSLTLSGELRLISAIRQLEKQRHFDFILFETAEHPIAGLYAVHKYHDRVIVRVHACSETEWILFRKTFYYRWKRPLTRMLMRKIRNIFSTTPYYIDFVKHWFLRDHPLAIASKRFEVIPNAVPHQQKLNAISVPLLSEHAGRLVLLTLGRLDYFGEQQKNFGRVLAALSLLRGRPYFQKLRLILVGKGAYQARLKELSVRLDVDATVIFIDQLDNAEVQELQRHCHGVVLASTFEGQSMFALESLANGAPMLVSGNGGLRGLVDHGRNGVMFDPLDVRDIAAQLDFFLSQMVSDIESVRAASMKIYSDRFMPGITANKFVGTLKTLAAMNAAGI